jgi:hypothetical protein
LSDEDWDTIVERIMRRYGIEKEDIGVWNGGAETSFRFETAAQAMEVAILFNQYSILDWRALTEGREDEAEIRIRQYNEYKEIDYVGIIKEILCSW